MIEDFDDVTKIARAGVYVLLWQGTVVYVGQSDNMLRRIHTHKHNARKQLADQLRRGKPSRHPVGMRFDQILVKPCAISDLSQIEGRLIEHFRPRYNMRSKPLMSFEQSQEYLKSGLVARIIAGRHERPQQPSAPRPSINRRGL